MKSKKLKDHELKNYTLFVLKTAGLNINQIHTACCLISDQSKSTLYENIDKKIDDGRIMIDYFLNGCKSLSYQEVSINDNRMY